MSSLLPDDIPAANDVFDVQEPVVPPETSLLPGALAHDLESFIHEEDTPPAEVIASDVEKVLEDSKSPGTAPSAKPASSSVKKIIASGTVGSGTAKPVVLKATVKPTTTASPVKKTSSAPQPIRSSMPAKAPAAAAALPSRRVSLTAKPPLSTTVKNPLAASTATKPASRLSAVSPDSNPGSKTPTAARPRSSVVDGVKRTSSASKSATSGTPRPSSTIIRPTRTPGIDSISSMKEIKGNDNSAELQNKLVEVTASLSVRDASIVQLESQVTTAQASLDAALVELETKRSTLQELELTKVDTERKLKEALDSLQALQEAQAHHADDSVTILDTVQAELQTSRNALVAEQEVGQTLQSQIKDLESQIAVTKVELETLQVASQAASAAAIIEHEVLVKSQADLDTIRAETEKLKTAHSQALEEATSKIREFEAKTSDIDNLESEISLLKGEKGEAANRISELEIEVLEAKESVDQAEDNQAKASGLVKSLEEKLTKAIADSKAALNAKVAEYASQLEASQTDHEEESNSLKAVLESLSAQLVKLESQLADAQAALEKAHVEQLATAEEHTMNIQTLEQSHQDALAESNAELQRVATELADQEKIYNAKVDVVKSEHDQRLQEAFQRASDKHSEDLQILRVESKAAIDQVRDAHEKTIENLKAEHAAALDEQIKTLEKQISNQNLELKATQDDLAKAKSALASSLQEFENVKLQLEEARKLVESVEVTVPVDYESELARLSKELSNSREEQSGLQEVLAVQEETIMEMAESHAKELEEAAKGRAEEAMKFRATHETEIAALSKEKSELLSRLSDVEGDLATLKASIESEPVTASRTNGSAQPSSPGVTKEEIQRMHEAHNMKMNDMEAEFDKTVRVLKDGLDTSHAKVSELELEVNRKGMEISYLELDQEENQDQIIRLKEDIESLREQLQAKD